MSSMTLEPPPWLNASFNELCAEAKFLARDPLIMFIAWLHAAAAFATLIAGVRLLRMQFVRQARSLMNRGLKVGQIEKQKS